MIKAYRRQDNRLQPRQLTVQTLSRTWTQFAEDTQQQTSHRRHRRVFQCRLATEARAPRITPEIPILNSEGARELVLIVDDEPEIAEFASTILAEEGYKVIIARDGFEALKIFQQLHREIGLIILDFFLPVMDGDAVFEELKAINPGVDVVLSSGFAEQNKIGAMLAQGLRGFIPKPYTREKLLGQVRSTLDAPRRPAR